MVVEQIVMEDFSGGYVPYRAASDFSERQWSVLDGVVIEDVARLRSQWGLQRVGNFTGTLNGLVHLAGYLGNPTPYLVAVASNGGIHYMTMAGAAPRSDDAVSSGFTWTQVDATLYDGGIDPTNYRGLCAVPMRDASGEGFRSGLLMNTVFSVSSDPLLLYHGSTMGLEVKVIPNRWPAYDPDGITPAGSTMPPAQYGTMWGDMLVLGDSYWFVDAAQPMSNMNSRRYRNMLYISEPTSIAQFDPLNVVFVGDPHGGITGLQVIDAGLLVFTSNGPSALGGVWLLRGQPDSFELELLVPGVGAASGVALWAHTTSVAWLSETGEVWHTNGEETARLDPYGLHEGPRSTSSFDWLAGFGPWLLAGLSDRIFCLAAFEGLAEAAWTELIPPGTDAVWPVVMGDQLYFLSDGNCWRFQRGTEAEQGLSGGVAVTSTVATRTLSVGGGHAGTLWHRFGLRVTGPGEVADVTLRPGPSRDTAVPTLPYVLGQPVGGGRHEVVVRGHGPSVEASAEWHLSGDVSVEAASAWGGAGAASR